MDGTIRKYPTTRSTAAMVFFVKGGFLVADINIVNGMSQKLKGRINNVLFQTDSQAWSVVLSVAMERGIERGDGLG